MIKKPLLLILLITLTLTSALLVKLAFSKGWFISYLSVNKPVSPDLLILEGWVSDTTIHLAAKEFHDGNYARILTSGAPTDPNYLLPEDGYLEFSFSGQSVNLNSEDTISFTLRGTPVQGTYPEYKIFINNQLLKSGFTDALWKRYSFILDSAISVEKISVSFTNDAHYLGEDRNMEVKCLFINSVQYRARSRHVLHYKLSDSHRLNPLPTYFSSVAEKCAYELQKQGIPEHVIEAVPSPVSEQNRTLASAIVLAYHLEKKSLPLTAVNIMSEGIHARRTWISYRFALDYLSDAVGIICVPPARSYHPDLQSYTNKEILRELMSIVYYKFFFNKNRYRKELIQLYQDYQQAA